MNTKSFLECEADNLKKLEKYQLPHYFKKVGFILFLISFLGLFINKFSINQIELKVALKYGMLIGLLLVSISKEKIEDELVSKLRMQSYTFAFICAVVYAIVLPFIAFLIDYMLDSATPLVKELGDFTVLFMLLATQVFYLEFFKEIT